jgi:hypothetical protein
MADEPQRSSAGVAGTATPEPTDLVATGNPRFGILCFGAL